MGCLVFMHMRHAACHYVGTVPDGMIPEKYSLSNYILSYEGTIMSLFDEAYWPLASYKLMPPTVIALVDRPGRRQSTIIPNEMDISDCRCSDCRGANHHVRSCMRLHRS